MFRLDEPTVKLKGLIRWSWLNECVSELKRIRFTCVMLAASGVPMLKVCPYWIFAAPLDIVGRVPLNKYGGEKISAVAPLTSPPAERTVPSGNKTAFE